MNTTQTTHAIRDENNLSRNPNLLINGQHRPLHAVSQKVIVNDLLANLQHASMDTSILYPELVRLPELKTLFDCGEPIVHIYFPTTAIVSLFYIMNDGAAIEVASIGQEGMVGMWWGVGERAVCRAVVQSGGYAYRLKVQAVRDAISHGGVLPQLLMCYANALFASVAHKAIGGKRNSATQALSQWLLDRCDRSLTYELKVTHELIASMLGVRRETITAAMGKLQSSGTVQCCRGKVIILDRIALERCAGQRYSIEAVSPAYD